MLLSIDIESHDGACFDDVSTVRAGFERGRIRQRRCRIAYM